MKKYYFIIGIAAAMFAACSSSEDVLTKNTQEPIDANMTREQLMGNIPIEFAGVDTGVKVDVEIEEETRGATTAVPENQQLGIFCLSYKKLVGDDVLGPSYLNWEDDATYKTLNKWQDNGKGHIGYLNNSSLGVLYWDDRDTPHYYPKSDYFAYQFAAYQPYTDIIVSKKSTIYAWIVLDGDDDVMHAFSKGPRNGVVDDELAAYAYGNHYFSEVVGPQGTNEITPDHKPYFSFSHLLTKLVFNVKLKDGAATSGRTFRVDSISIRNLVNIARLTVATKDGTNSLKGGTLSCFGDVNSSSVADVKDILQARGITGRSNFWLREEDGSSIRDLKEGNAYKYELSTTAKPIGHGIFIPASSGTLKLDVFLCDQDGYRSTSQYPITVNVPEGGWKAGKYYNLNITLTPPKYFMDDTRGQINEWDGGATVDEIEAEF